MTRNYVFIVLDCVRKDYFDRYAQRIKELSDVSFNECRAASSWSPPSHGSIFSGELPQQHGIHTYDKDFAKLDQENTFFSVIPEHQTLAVNANPILDDYHFSKLFDKYSEEIWLYENPLLYDENTLSPREWKDPQNGSSFNRLQRYIADSIKSARPVKSLLNGLYHEYLFDRIHKMPIPKITDDGASKVIESSIERINSTSSKFFLFNNFMDAHWEYQNLRVYDQSLNDVSNTWKSSQSVEWRMLLDQSSDGHEQYVTNRRKLYTSAIDYLDRKVAKYIKEIDKITDRETTFIVTSDHGENLAYPDDNDLLHHKSSMTESLLHVPFEIINPPTGYDDTESGLFSHLQLKQLFKGFENETAPDVFTNRVPAERIGTIKLADLLDIVDRFDLNDNQLTKKHNFLDRCIRCVYEKDVKYEWDSYGNTLKYQIDGESSQEMVDDETQIPQFCKSLFDSSISEVERSKRSEDSKESLDDEAKGRLKKLGYL